VAVVRKLAGVVEVSKYNVSADIKVSVCIMVGGKTLEEALAEARKLEVTDFVTIEGDYLDGELEITGVY
jgi:hypothetical protein